MPGRDSSSRRDLHAEITKQLIAAIEAGPGEPQMPWHRSGHSLGLPINALSNMAYNGINIISLWCAGLRAGFSSVRWATYRQWADKGCQVRRGEEGSPVVFYRQYSVDADPDDADDGQRRVARLSVVFNADQVDGSTDPDLDRRTHIKPDSDGLDPSPKSKPSLPRPVRSSNTVEPKPTMIESWIVSSCHREKPSSAPRQRRPRRAFMPSHSMN